MTLRDPDEKPQCLIDRSGIRKCLSDIWRQANGYFMRSFSPRPAGHDAQCAEIVFGPQFVVHFSAKFRHQHRSFSENFTASHFAPLLQMGAAGSLA